MLWEADERAAWTDACVCEYEKKMAEDGLVWWADVTDPETGEWLEWPDVAKRRGTKLSGEADAEAYARVRARLNSAENATAVMRWRKYVREEHAAGRAIGAGEELMRAGALGGQHGDQWAYETVLAARRTAACFGGWEYCVRWAGGEVTWENACVVVPQGPGRAEFMSAQTEKYVPCT